MKIKIIILGWKKKIQIYIFKVDMKINGNFKKKIDCDMSYD